MQQYPKIIYEYNFVSNDCIYFPVFTHGRWYLVGAAGKMPQSLSNVAHLCKIPPEDVVVLKLKYGA